jgi:hypothetical protein
LLELRAKPLYYSFLNGLYVNKHDIPQTSAAISTGLSPNSTVMPLIVAIISALVLLGKALKRIRAKAFMSHRRPRKHECSRNHHFRDLRPMFAGNFDVPNDPEEEQDLEKAKLPI